MTDLQMLEIIQEKFNEQFQPENKTRDWLFLCIIADSVEYDVFPYGLISHKFTEYLGDNLPKDSRCTKSQFHNFNSIVFQNDIHRSKWLTEQIKNLKDD